MNCWLPDHISVADSLLQIRLDDNPLPGWLSRPTVCVGRISQQCVGWVRAFRSADQASDVPGTVTAFFTYTGPNDNNPNDEIDIEILGRDPTRLQVNYFTQGVGGHETWIDLGFDAAAAFHTYAIEGKARRWPGTWMAPAARGNRRGPPCQPRPCAS
ncbi:family 16 glycosylhydrolase [Candidatus Amarolinea dominans]|uniref:family 16 glycosylhydrolase n=1 Tax=Candidatus Amarolinea dominans TaxID=3140696 RepID=UPI0031CC7319